MLKAILQKILSQGIKKRLKQKLGVPDHEVAFQRLKGFGFSPKYILDIGAYEGDWSLFIKTIFPEAKILMIEGQRSKEKILQKALYSISDSTLEIALLGSVKKTVEFNIYETASSVLKEDNETGASVEIRNLELLDDIVKDTPFEHPNLIKLDTQGYELEILKGGMKTLQKADAILMEVSFLNIYNDCPLADEVTSFMRANGFVLYDICSIMRRPLDNALYQSDFLFIKEKSALRSSTRWI